MLLSDVVDFLRSQGRLPFQESDCRREKRRIHHSCPHVEAHGPISFSGCFSVAVREQDRERSACGSCFGEEAGCDSVGDERDAFFAERCGRGNE